MIRNRIIYAINKRTLSDIFIMRDSSYMNDITDYMNDITVLPKANMETNEFDLADIITVPALKLNKTFNIPFMVTPIIKACFQKMLNKKYRIPVAYLGYFKFNHIFYKYKSCSALYRHFNSNAAIPVEINNELFYIGNKSILDKNKNPLFLTYVSVKITDIEPETTNIYVPLRLYGDSEEHFYLHILDSKVKINKSVFKKETNVDKFIINTLLPAYLEQDYNVEICDLDFEHPTKPKNFIKTQENINEILLNNLNL